jgi:hypothetical protein
LQIFVAGSFSVTGLLLWADCLARGLGVQKYAFLRSIQALALESA